MRDKDKAWSFLFDELSIIDNINEHGFFNITSKKIKDLTGQEPRIICKQDSTKQIPIILRENSVNLLAIKNGEYLLFKDPGYKGYINLDYKDISPKYLNYQENKFKTLRIDELTTEKKAFKFAAINGLLESSFNEKLFESVSDRFYCSPFTLNLGDNKFNVKSVQIEIDALYEGNDDIFIFELKNTTSDDFNIRQLYYPYQHFISKLEETPKTTLIQFSNGIYYLTKIQFTENYYNYEIISNEAFVFDNYRSNNFNLKPLLNQKLSNFPTPQADDLNKIFDLLNLVKFKNTVSKEDITDFFGFDKRQTDYYLNAAKYLNLVADNNSYVILLGVGSKISNTESFSERNMLLLAEILKIKLFNKIYIKYISSNKIFDDNYIVSTIMKLDNRIKSLVTAKRRMSTIKNWIRWIDRVINSS